MYDTGANNLGNNLIGLLIIGDGDSLAQHFGTLFVSIPTQVHLIPFVLALEQRLLVLVFRVDGERRVLGAHRDDHPFHV